MCARRFLIAVFILTLLVVAAGFAIYQWGGDILLRQATPKGHFHAPTNEAGAPDYRLAANWLSNPTGQSHPADWLPDGATSGSVGEAAVFYIHPTTYLTGDRWNAPLHADPLTESRNQLFVKSQASAFSLA